MAAACGPPPQPTSPAVTDLRAIWLRPADWAHTEADSAAASIRRFVGHHGATHKLLLVQVGRDEGTPTGLDPLAVAMEAAGDVGVSVHAAISLGTSSPELLPEGAPKGSADARVRWKQIARHLATHYAIDGLHVSDAADSLVALGVAAEALLVKPYLSISGFPLTTVDLTAVDPTRIVSLDLSAWRADAAGREVHIDSALYEPRADAAGRVAMILPARPDTLQLRMGGDTLSLETRFWKLPYRYAVKADGSVTRTAPWVESRATPPAITTREAFEFLGHTDPTAAATINGVSAKVYATGVFFDSVALPPGTSRVRLQAQWPDGGGVAMYEQQFERHISPVRPTRPLWIDKKSVTPTDSLMLLPSDVVRLRFRGSPGQQARAHVRPGNLEIPFQRTDGDNSATYKADLQLSRLQTGRDYHVEIRLQQADGGNRVRHRLSNPIRVRDAHDFPLVVTSAAESYVSYSLGAVRLGGPYLAEYPKGVVLQSTGRFGQRYRVRFGPHRQGYISSRYVDEAATGTVLPGYHITTMSARATDSTDVVRIPRPEPVPYLVHSDPEGRRIVVTLFGAQTSSTWIAHRSGTRFVDRVSWRQLDAETYEASIHLNTDRIWGYDVWPEGGSLVISLRHPPKLGSDESQPLLGLKVAIEAGHGGTSTGAIGLSGALERDVNLQTALVLEDLCKTAGARVVQLREAIDGIPYMARRDSVRASGADVFLSIHANAAGGGFLRIKGTSTFYHDPFWSPLATSIYGEILDLGLNEFGVVGSFNYRPTRMSSVPAVLVEQAFMTHAEDEEFLTSEAGRRAIAEKILAGLLAWLAEQPTDVATDEPTALPKESAVESTP